MPSYKKLVQLIIRLDNKMKRILKTIYFKIKNINKNVYISWKSNILNNTIFEGYNKVWDNSTFGGKLGLCSYIGANCFLRAKVGRFTSIAYGCESITGRHTYKAPFVSTSPVFISTKGQTGLRIVEKDVIDEMVQADKENNYDIIIGNDCWLGYKVSVVSGIKIGDGAVALSHSFVTKDIPPYAIVAGIPAKIIGYRYNEEQIKDLLRIKWWDFPLQQIIDNKELFLDIDKFISKFK